MLLDRQKRHPNAVSAGLRKLKSQLPALPNEKLMRDLDQHTSSIASLRIAPASTAVRQVDEHLDSLADNLVTLMPRNTRDESDPTSVVLMRRIVQTLGMRQA